MTKILALCGGVGGAKLAYGLSRILGPDELSIAVNTGDDFEHLGLLICPDIDTVTYTLSETANKEQGWGREGESFTVLDEVGRLGGDTWFRLGDKDIALHLLRRSLLDKGLRLTDLTAEIAKRFGIAHPILPMTDDRLRTIVETDNGNLNFQDYFVGRRCEPKATGFHFDGAKSARLSPRIDALLHDPDLSGVLICPSNPFVSIGPILATGNMRARLAALKVPVLAVSPIIAGQAIKGPAAKMMKELGFDVSSLEVARLYSDILDGLIIDEQDRHLLAQRKDTDPSLFVAQTFMRNNEDRIALARECLKLLHELRNQASPRA